MVRVQRRDLSVGGLTAAVFLAVAVFGSGSARAADPSCPATYKDVPAAERAGEYKCACPADAPGGSVWGSGIYTTDSSICTAAAHAGAILKAVGGTVTLKAAPGCGKYKGSTGNGITTGDWGAYDASFYFVGKGDGACYVATAGECPKTYKQVPAEKRAPEFSCTCPGGAGGSVWGSGIYTTDSVICVAAVHAGAVPASGGSVTIKPAAGCAKYVGTTSNGVTTGSWGAYDASFYFAGKGDGACAP